MIRSLMMRAMLALAMLGMMPTPAVAQVDPAARGLAMQAKAAVRGIPTPTVLNNSAASLRKWTAARSRALAAGGLATINYVGDSTQGYKGSGTGATLVVAGQPRSMAASVVKLLNGWAGRGDFARTDGFWGGHSSLFATDLAEFITYDTRWSLGNLTAGTSARLGGVNLRIPASSTTAFTYQATLPYDRVRVVYARYSSNTTTIAVSSASGGSGTVTANAISGGGSNGGDLQSTTISVTRGAGLLTFTPSGGSTATDLIVVEMWDSTIGQVIVRDIAAAGSMASQWVTQTPAALAQVPADYTNYCWTLNESAAGVLPDAFEASLRSVMALGSPGSISLTVENESSAGGFGGLPLQRGLADRIRTLGASIGAPVIDVPARWGDYVAANDNGRMGDSGHPNGAGYADKAVAQVQILTQ